MKNVILCGFMGCGKSTVGRAYARLVHARFIDMDWYLEEKNHMKITQIFEQYGESVFRRMETECARELSAQSGLVIAAGGGTLLYPQNIDALKQNGIIVLLDVPLAALQERLRRDTRRPLLQKPNREQVINELYHQRMPLYRQAADITIPAGAPVSIVARRIQGALQKNRDNREKKIDY